MRNHFWLISFLFLISLVSGSLTASIYFYASQKDPLIIPRVSTSDQSHTIYPTLSENSPSLTEIISSALTGTTGKYGIAVKNFVSGESYYLNAHQTFSTGSLYKLWVMAAIYQLFDSGVLQGNTILTKNVVDLNTEFGIASDEAELTDGVASSSVNDAMSQMITVSDNYSALLLSDRVGLTGLSDILQKYSLMDSRVGVHYDPPITSPQDVAVFLEQLYRGRLASPSPTASMLSLLKGQKLNDKLPKNLPAETVIAHKTGEIDNFTHDAGIIYTPKGDYIIVVLSQSDAPALAENRISDISLAVYNYFTK